VLTRRNESILWVALLVLAAFLRLAPIAASLPYIDYVDEGYVLHQSIHLLNQRTWDTAWYGYPSLPAYLTAGGLIAWNPIYRNVHGHHFRNDLPSEDVVQTSGGYNYDLISPPELILAGRAVAAGLSVGTVVLAGAIASRLRGRKAGLLAILITAFCPALVLRGSNVIVDTFATFFALLAVFLCLRIRPGDKWSLVNAAAAGLTAGLAFACKYTAGAVFAGVIGMICAVPGSAKLRFRLGLIATGGLMCGIALGAPAAFLNWRTVMRDVAITAANYRLIDSSPGYFGQAVSAIELGWPLAIAGLIGLILMLRRQPTRSAAIGWCIFAALLLAAFATRPFQPFRNLLPLVPMSCVAAAVAGSTLVEWSWRGRWPQLRWAAVLAVIALCADSFLFSLYRPIRQRLTHRDSRAQAIDWLVEHARKAERVLGIRELAMLPAEWKRVAGPVTVVPLSDATDLLERERFDYVVTGEFDLRYAPDPGRASAALARWKELVGPGAVEAEFGASPAFVVPYLWRSNDERIFIVRANPAKTD
jgi:4-amino-4-deoxy-L-arabinose transferase-like glycosyltransferase